MSDGVVVMMLIVSISLGGAGLAALLWGLKSRQFEDHRKFLEGALDDGEDALNDAYELEKRREEFKNRR
ncbi:cbb3-type cytochrome oxidase assembly protein CcoS [Campylobacter sp. 19-13652]|uniref:cbb3-type cytochrome oxidase assembly protein CcoS n=1 Tax=Campylobacter sp. 19-13652 TaxID=2840180 RepID=UPI001C795F88|nr:cbb3-type cytochrome oxidase assembly protein CcoS [Campylobacter sp. 19-13652]BCX80061.1 cytochrome c oxidase subunit II [Campylobacter sp. 19-13652]